MQIVIQNFGLDEIMSSRLHRNRVKDYKQSMHRKVQNRSRETVSSLGKETANAVRNKRYYYDE